MGRVVRFGVNGFAHPHGGLPNVDDCDTPLSDRFDRRPMATHPTVDSSGEAWRQRPHDLDAGSDQRDFLFAADGLCMADVAQGLSAQEHRLRLLLPLEKRRSVATHSRHIAGRSPQGSRARRHAQRGHHRQPIDQDHRKKGVRGYDAGKKVTGRKRHILVDTMGLLLMVVVHAANIQDRDGAKLVLEKVRGRFPRLKLIWADGGYAGKLIDWVKQTCGWVLEIVKRNADLKGFHVLPRRWVVERTFGWLGRYRRFSKDYEEFTESSEAMIHLAMIHLMLRRLHPIPKTQKLR